MKIKKPITIRYYDIAIKKCYPSFDKQQFYKTCYHEVGGASSRLGLGKSKVSTLIEGPNINTCMESETAICREIERERERDVQHATELRTLLALQIHPNPKNIQEHEAQYCVVEECGLRYVACNPVGKRNYRPHPL